CFTMDRERVQHYSLVMAVTLLAGVSGSFLTGDLFNLFVWFEVMLMASFVLMAQGGWKRQLPAAVRYLAFNLVGSTLFLTGCGLIYALTGTLNMAHLAERLPLVEPGLAIAVSSLFLVAFGLKAAAFPLFPWLPGSYPVPPVAVSAILAGLLTKVGVYSMFRFFTLVQPLDGTVLQPMLYWSALLTMVIGVLGAYSQSEYRRILSFHIVSQIGYMLLALSWGTGAALAAGIFMAVHNMAAKTGLFFLSGAAEESCGTGVLKKMGGLREAQPAHARLFMICALGLAGIPPLSGFWAKLAVVKSGGEFGDWFGVGVGLAVGVFTLLSMVKIWNEAYWKPAPDRAPTRSGPMGHLVPAGLMAGLVLLLGVAAGPASSLFTRIGQELTAPDVYIGVVLPDEEEDL
ncbi:MAG: hypothetical protein MH204_05150, partial [Fimbriimonadaceae bacterium]|nr:hypothetical protein [Fimbriimonadaceae bacterium]